MDANMIRRLTGEALPASLCALPRPCRELFVAGELPPETIPKIAIVGSRAASPGGEQVAYEIAFALAKHGAVVVSGLARGIDSAAHRGALDAGGSTVAFLGNGIDVVYPKSSRRLGEEIARQGAMVSEYPSGAPPLAYRFVERNRLVAGYSLGTLVVEAGARSGALITAGISAALGRELWAVPGDPRRPSCRGSNRLLRDGAGVVLDALDVLAALGLAQAGRDRAATSAAPTGLSRQESAAWRCLAVQGPADAETLSRRSGLTAAALLEALSLLELAGHITREGEGFALAERGRQR
jgi:DNA processing protein